MYLRLLLLARRDLLQPATSPATTTSRIAHPAAVRYRESAKKGNQRRSWWLLKIFSDALTSQVTIPCSVHNMLPCLIASSVFVGYRIIEE
jgi:hypothetical protein